MKIRRKYTPIYKNAHGAAAPQDRPERHDHRARPGHERGGRGCRRAAPSRSTRRCPTSTPTSSFVARRATRAATCSCCSAARGEGARAATGESAVGRRLSASSRPRATSPGSTARSPCASATSAARSTTSACSRRRSAPRTTTLAALVDSSNARVQGVRRPGRATCARRCSELPGHAAGHEHRRWPRPTELGNVLGPTLGALRPGARALGPALVQTRPVPARDDADHPEPAAAVRARGAAGGQGPAPGGERPGGGHAEADHVGQGPQLPAQRARLQPAGQGGGLPLLGVVGQPRRRDGLLHPGRARPDPPRPGAGLLLDAGGARAAQRPGPAARHADRACSTRPTRRSVCPTTSAGRRRRRRSAARGASR